MKLSSTLLLLSISLQSQAYQSINVSSDDIYHGVDVFNLINFNDTSKETYKNSTVTVVKKKNGTEVFYTTRISSAVNGKQSLYFEDNVKCKYKENAEPKDGVMKILKQKIKVLTFCSAEGFTYYTPTTYAGTNYVIKQFKALKIVPVEFPTAYYPVLFDATGFSKVWSSFGGDAL